MAVRGVGLDVPAATLWAALVFCLSALALYTASAVYHYYPGNELTAGAKRFLRKMDHSMEEKHIRFRMDTSGVTTPYVVIDRLRIQQVYVNILSNAIKFSESGSEISCTVRHIPWPRF